MLEPSEKERLSRLVRRAVEIAGSQKRLADAVGVSQRWIGKLANGEIVRPIRAELAVAIDEFTKGEVPRHELCPQIFSAPAPAEGEAA